MGLFDRSSSQNTTNLTEQNITETRQADQSGGSFNFNEISGGVSLSLSDQGAIDAGRELGLAGIDVVKRVNADSLAILAGLANNSIDASKTIARDSAESNAGFLQQALSGFGALAKQNSQSADDRLTKIVGFALLAVVVAVVGPAIFKGGGRAVLT